jgi:hypothetical protein
MIRIEKVRNYRLSNVLHLQFFVALMNLIRKFTPEVLKISVFSERLRTCIEREELCFKLIHKSDLSILKANKDQLRDDVVVGIRNRLKSDLLHFDPLVCEAAYRLMLLLERYNKPIPLINLPYDAETAAINNMLQELVKKYAADVKTTGLETWIEELRVRNNAFDQVAIAYNEQQSEKPPFLPKEVRRETDAVYKDIVLVISAAIVSEGDEAYSPFVTELNTLIKHYNDLLMQHLGRVRAKKEKEKKKQEEKENQEQGTDENSD